MYDIVARRYNGRFEQVQHIRQIAWKAFPFAKTWLCPSSEKTDRNDKVASWGENDA